MQIGWENEMGRKEDNKERRRKIREEVARIREERQTDRVLRCEFSSERRFFGAKARRGDVVELKFEFSGIPVPYTSEENPSEGIVERTTQQKAYWDSLPKDEEPN